MLHRLCDPAFVDEVQTRAMPGNYSSQLRCPMVDVRARALWIDPDRRALSSVAGRLVFTAPKTVDSAAGVGVSQRVVDAQIRQAERQTAERAEWDDAYEDDGLVFARENGAPLTATFRTY